MSEELVYVYGIARDAELGGVETLGPGIAGEAVTLLPVAGLAVIVGPAASKEMAPTRRHMLTHTAVLERALARASVLPMRFGTIAPDAAALGRCVEGNAPTFEAALAEIDGRVELGVKASWREGVIFREIVDADPGLRAMRDRLRSRPASETYYERIELGRRVEEAVTDRRAKEGDALVAPLRALAERVIGQKLIDEAMIVNEAFLVRRDREAAFDEAMQDIAARGGERLELRYVGPVPPYNFVSVRADWLTQPGTR